MTTEFKKVFNDYIAAWNSHDVDKIASFFTEDAIHEDVAIGSIYHGRNELKAGLIPLFSACPDFKLKIKSFFSNADCMAQEWIMTGTQTGTLEGLGIPATGKSFSIRGVSIIRFHGDKITRNTDYWNLKEMLKQLGQE